MRMRVPGQPGVVDSWVVWGGRLSLHLRYRRSILEGNDGGVRGAVAQVLRLLLPTGKTPDGGLSRRKDCLLP